MVELNPQSGVAVPTSSTSGSRPTVGLCDTASAGCLPLSSAQVLSMSVLLCCWYQSMCLKRYSFVLFFQWWEFWGFPPGWWRSLTQVMTEMLTHKLKRFTRPQGRSWTCQRTAFGLGHLLIPSSSPPFILVLLRYGMFAFGLCIYFYFFYI